MCLIGVVSIRFQKDFVNWMLYVEESKQVRQKASKKNVGAKFYCPKKKKAHGKNARRREQRKGINYNKKKTTTTTTTTTKKKTLPARVRCADKLGSFLGWSNGIVEFSEERKKERNVKGRSVDREGEICRRKEMVCISVPTNE